MSYKIKSNEVYPVYAKQYWFSICRYIYWINTNLTTSTVERARFDGSDREVFISATYEFDLHSLAIDEQAHKIYWIEPETRLLSRIYRANLNRKNPIYINMLRHTCQDTDILLLTHPNVLTISKNNFFLVDWCSNNEVQNVWKYQMPEMPSGNFKPLIKVQTGGAVGIATNYKMKDQFQGTSDCIQVPHNYEIDDSLKIAREYYVGSYCVQGAKVDGQSFCKCSPGYSGDRCEVPICENYCLQGNCSLTEEGLPECR